MNLKIHRLKAESLSKDLSPNYNKADLDKALSVLTNVCHNIELNTTRMDFRNLLIPCMGKRFMSIKNVSERFKKVMPQKSIVWKNPCQNIRNLLKTLQDKNIVERRKRKIRYIPTVLFRLTPKGACKMRDVVEGSLKFLPKV